MGLKEEQENKPFKIVLERKVNGHYLAKQTSHLYCFLISGRIVYGEINSFALPLMGNSLLGCCCRAKSQGEETYSNSASSQEQACRASKESSPSPITWHCQVRGRCYAVGSPLHGISRYQNQAPHVKSDLRQTEPCQPIST